MAGDAGVLRIAQEDGEGQAADDGEGRATASAAADSLRE